MTGGMILKASRPFSFLQWPDANQLLAVSRRITFELLAVNAAGDSLFGQRRFALWFAPRIRRLMSGLALHTAAGNAGGSSR